MSRNRLPLVLADLERRAAAGADGAVDQVCGRWRQGGRLPNLRITGRWLDEAGFGLGQEVEVLVELERLTIRAV